jgi:hypothetical protein
MDWRSLLPVIRVILTAHQNLPLFRLKQTYRVFTGIAVPAANGVSQPRSPRQAGQGGKDFSEIPKYCFSPDPNQSYNYRHPARHEGRFAIVTDVGRDAVDAAAAQDERR